MAGRALLMGIIAIFMANASFGVVEIDQTLALAGGITPSDTPGFPVTIDQTGSYILTGNLTVPDANTTAIVVTAEGVTLDLNGFAIIGPATEAGPNGTGVGIQGGAGIVVFNGTIRGMGSIGLQMDSRSRAEKLHLYYNATGLTASVDSLITEVIAGRNRLDGIFVGSDTTIARCVTNENLRDGIRVTGSRCIIIGNVATDNDRYGISTGTDCSLIQNNASRNLSHGMTLAAGTGYAQNIINANNGGNSNPQVSNGGIQIGTNICGGDTICP